MEDKKINDIIEELNTFDLLSERKAVICYNPLFLEKDDGDNIKNLKKYLENPSSNILILVTRKLSTRVEIKDLLKYFEIVNAKISSEVLVKQNLESCHMDNNIVKYFTEYCSYDNEKILNELRKLINYKYDKKDKKITKEVMDLLEWFYE